MADFCSEAAVVKRPEDGELVQIFCECAECHLVPHLGHIYYGGDLGVLESRCVEWPLELPRVEEALAH